MLAVVTIARLAVLRLLRERANVFFVFVFPLMLILLIGLSFGSTGGATILVVGSGADEGVVAITDSLDRADGVRAVRVNTRDLALDALARGRADGVLVLSEGFAGRLASGQSQALEIAFRDEARGLEPVVRAAVDDVVAPHRAAALARLLGVDEPSAASLAREPVPELVQIATVALGDDLAQEFAGLDQFELGAASQLILFVFLTTLAGASRLVESRQMGTTRRMLAGPVSAAQVILGEGLGRFAVAIFQGAWVIAGGLLLFSVNWGSPVAALLVLAAFSLVAAASAMLLGALARNVNQASGLATLLGLTLAALGGCMAPLDIFSDGLRRVAHVTPHAWANDAFAELTRRQGSVGDVLTEIAVLLLFAMAIGSLAAVAMRRAVSAN